MNQFLPYKDRDTFGLYLCKTVPTQCETNLEYNHVNLEAMALALHEQHLANSTLKYCCKWDNYLLDSSGYRPIGYIARYWPPGAIRYEGRQTVEQLIFRLWRVLPDLDYIHFQPGNNNQQVLIHTARFIHRLKAAMEEKTNNQIKRTRKGRA